MAPVLDNLARTAATVVAHARPRTCPVCGELKAEILHRNNMAHFAGFDFSAPVQSCQRCGAAYAGEALDQADLDRYYSTLSKYDTPQSAAEISQLDQVRAAMAIDFLAPHLSRFRSAIEIGSSVGYLLHQLHGAGVATAHGLDPASAAAEAGRRLFGVEVRTGYAESFSEYGRYDLVLLRAVLEHLREPAAILQQIGSQLAPGAHLFIEVPDAGAFDRPEGGVEFEPFGEFSNEHINYLAIGDLAALAAGSGMEVVSWRSIRVFGSLPGLFALLRRNAAPAHLPEPDRVSAASRTRSREALTAYIDSSRRRFDAIEDRLAGIRGREVLIYGAGNHTLRLLAHSAALRTCRVRAVADRNANFHGHFIGDVPIVAPATIADFPYLALIVSTFNARREIAIALRKTTSQPILQLYD